MAKRKFTRDQLLAINERGKTLLVSAAAGSGKTATLTERIIRSITDDKSPQDIRNMLIVTFTNAAVADLKEKIGAAVRDALIENPGSERLQAQLYALPLAKISTIDSFCNDILKNNTEKFGLSPKYRIADTIEANLLSHSILSAMIDSAYNGEISGISAEDFEQLTVSLTGVKNNSSLEDVFLFLYDKTKSHERGALIFRDFVESLAVQKTLPIEENVYGRYAMERTRELATHYKALFNTVISGSNPGKDGPLYIDINEKYVPVIEEDIKLLTHIEDAHTYHQMQTALNTPFAKLPAIKGGKSPDEELYVTARNKLKKLLRERYLDRYFSYSDEEWREHIDALSSLLNTLSVFITEFDRAYFEEKKNRSMLEYSDIERLTYLSLYDEGERPSELALALRDRYSSIYIDEYQDVNPLQNKIFLAISKPNNRFTVGDIKQSIYGFRNACPEIFADMKNSYPPYSEAEHSDNASIFMSKNFRCDRGIIDFVNDIFDTVFALNGKSIGYVTEDRLEFGKLYDSDEPPYRAPKIQLFTKADAEENEDYEEIGASELSAKWTAEKISELLEHGKLNSGEPIEPRHIAIILRKNQGRSQVYEKALQKLSIPSRAPEDKDFFLNSEIQLVLCLLNSINNPQRDIYLAGLMLSPIFDFTPDDMCLVKGKKGLSLYKRVVEYSKQNPENTKFSYFINTLARYRKISEGMQIDALIMRLYNETGLLALAKSDGSRENLLLLYNYARKFEASSFKGLYNFINYVNTVISSKNKFSSGIDTEEENAVTIITAHKSKGLEYPIVFLADAAAPFTSQNERRTKVAYSEELGIGFKIRRPGGLALVESPIYNIIVDRNVDKGIEEELRVYYVALTRAREDLYITGTVKALSKEDYLAAARPKKAYKSSYSIREMSTFVDILHFVDTKADINWQEDIPDKSEDYAAPVSNIEDCIPDFDLEYNEVLYEKIKERLTYKYPDPHATTLPEKMSISNLSPSVLDGTEDEDRLTIEDRLPTPSRVRAKLPEFICPSPEQKSRKSGIVTHNFLQFFDIERLDAWSVKEELDCLVRLGFISQSDASLVRIDELAAFKKSKLYQDMKTAKKLYREFRFNIMLPAAMFTESEEKRIALKDKEVLLQGVIDCIILDSEGKIHLIDYKTDRLTKEEISDRSLAKKVLSDKHSLQLSYYAIATEKILGKAPSSVEIYSLALGDTVSVELKSFGK